MTSYFSDDWIEKDRRSVMAMRERADRMRAMIMWDKHRSIVVWDSYLWHCLGWDIANMCDDLRHPSEAVAKVFNVPLWKPTQDELTWFRSGFAGQKAGRSRPVIRG